MRDEWAETTITVAYYVIIIILYNINAAFRVYFCYDFFTPFMCFSTSIIALTRTLVAPFTEIYCMTYFYTQSLKERGAGSSIIL